MTNGWQWGHVNKRVALLNRDWRQRLQQYTQLYIGYSGGLDSTVLLTALAECPELRNKLTAVHVHHGLSPHADRWLDHCQQYCLDLDIPYISKQVDIMPGSNLEERARIARYQVFEELIGNNDALLLAHHQNDQSETVLLNLLRGAGLDGLCAMPEQRACGAGVLLRPLLHHPRQALQDYAKQHSLQWIEDEMNTACEWSRVYLRQEIIPLLQVKWPNLIATVAAGAQHCQQAKQALEGCMAVDCPDLSKRELTLTPDWLNDTVRCTYVLRAWLKQHLQRPPSRACIQQIFHTVILASPDAMPCLQVEDLLLRRYQQTLYLVETQVSQSHTIIWENFPQPLRWSHDLMVMAIPDTEQGITIPNQSRIELKIRQGGEKFHWHGQNQCLKKLFQQWQIPPWQRSCLPLLYVNDLLMAVPGYAHSDLSLSIDPAERYTITMLSK